MHISLTTLIPWIAKTWNPIFIGKSNINLIIKSRFLVCSKSKKMVLQWTYVKIIFFKITKLAGLKEPIQVAKNRWNSPIQLHKWSNWADLGTGSPNYWSNWPTWMCANLKWVIKIQKVAFKFCLEVWLGPCSKFQSISCPRTGLMQELLGFESDTKSNYIVKSPLRFFWFSRRTEAYPINKLLSCPIWAFSPNKIYYKAYSPWG